MSNQRNVIGTLNISINLDKIPKEKIVKGDKGSYANMTALIFDSDDQYGKNATAMVSKTPEERDSKAETIYLGNGWYNVQTIPQKDNMPF